MPKAKYKVDKALNLYYTLIDTGIVDDSGKKVYKKIRAKTQALLDEKVKDFYKKESFGILHDQSNITVNDWYNIWFKSYKSTCTENTKKFYSNLTEKHILPILGARKISKITEAELQALLNNMSTVKDDRKNGQFYSEKTLKSIRSILFSLFDKAVKNKLIMSNPAIKLTVTGRPKKERQALTAPQRKSFIEAMSEHPYGGLAAILYFCGIRRGEAAALTRGDISDDWTLTVNKQFIYPNNHFPVFEDKTKTKAGVRSIPIPDGAVTILKKCFNFDKMSSNNLLFSNADGSPLNCGSFVKMFNDFRDYALKNDKNAKDVTFHVLRHNYCTLLFENGIDLLTAQELLGHADVKTTLEIYTHLSDEQKQKSFEHVREII